MKFKIISFMVAVTLVLAMSACNSPAGENQEMPIEGVSRAVGDGPTVTYSVSNWGTSFNGTFTITNGTSAEVSDWTLAFDWDWTINSVWSSSIVSAEAGHYVITNAGWNKNIAPGSSVTFGVSGSVGTAGAEPVNISVNGGGLDPVDPPPELPAEPYGNLAMAYGTTSETTTSFTGQLLAGNVNTVYTWNAAQFDADEIKFTTTSTITSVRSDNGSIPFTQTGNEVTLVLGWQSLFPLNTVLDIEINGTKSGAQPLPSNFRAHYVRGADIEYPTYQGLPASWTKGKLNVSAADLIANSADYYAAVVSSFDSKFIVYNAPHATQIPLGQVFSVPYPVNTVNAVRIHIPGKLMAMGIGLVYEYLKISPHYMTSLGTKENFAAGFVTPEAGNFVNPTIIDGEQWYWPIIAHPDGPYQQDGGNFNDVVKHFKDYFPASANHDNYTPISVNPNDPNWVSAAFSSGLSIAITREALYAIDADYSGFLTQASDPWAEFATVTFAYNRGFSNFLGKKLLSDSRAQAVASTDIAADFDMGGFASHVPTVRAIVEAMNGDASDLYDAQITWAEMETMLAKLKMFFRNGIPTDAEWTAMKNDVKRAFDVLKAHWGGQTISYRYDFLTLLRVTAAHLPQPQDPRPTGDDWYYLIKNAQP